MPSVGKESEQQRKLFIGGLDYRTSDDGLKAFYEQWGEIVDVIVMKDPKTRRSRGFGFVTYANPAMVDDAMANRPHVIDGREVEAKRAVPRDDSGRMENNVTVKKIFIGGIKDDVTEQDMHDYFGEFGEIVSVSMPVDKMNGKQRGFAFIEFKDYDSVDKIVLRKNHELNGKFVDVKKALSKQEMADLGSGGRGGGRGGRGGRGGGAGPWGEGGRGGGGGGRGGGWGGQQSQPWDSAGGGWGGQGGYQGGYGGGYGGGQQGGYNGGGGGYGGQQGGGYAGGYSQQGGFGGGYGQQSGGTGGYEGGYGSGGGSGWGGAAASGGQSGYGGGYGGQQGGGPMKNFSQTPRSAPYSSGQRGGGGGYGGGQGGGYNRF